MGKMTGMEKMQEIPPKVLALYEAVQQLIGEGEDVNDIRVSSITDRAGIGKGTAYDYFDSKEEIIACAFIFYVNRLSERISQKLSEKNGLKEQLEFLFDLVDEDSSKKYCFVRLVHLMTDNSKFSLLMQQKLHESAEGRNFPEYLFGNIVSQGQQSGTIRRDLPMKYLVYAVFCKMLTYMMCISTEECFGTDVSQMRVLVVQGILQELQA